MSALNQSASKKITDKKTIGYLLILWWSREVVFLMILVKVVYYSTYNQYQRTK